MGREYTTVAEAGQAQMDRSHNSVRIPVARGLEGVKRTIAAPGMPDGAGCDRRRGCVQTYCFGQFAGIVAAAARALTLIIRRFSAFLCPSYVLPLYFSSSFRL